MSGYTTTTTLKEGEYKGDLKDGKPHGYGKMIEKDGDVYEGEWKNGKMNGQGKVTEKYGDVYEGELKDGIMDGQGKMTFDDGAVYEGEWKQSLIDGQGKMTFANGAVYVGEWKEGLMDGQGKIMDGLSDGADGLGYEGEWKNGKRNGYGKNNLDGELYEGEWKDDKKNGQGKRTYANGDFYEGEWKNDHPTGYGKGKITYANGDVYEGKYKDYLKDGQGKMTYASGDVYEGEWKNNEYNGQGTFYLLSGDLYKGSFRYGTLWGRGIMKYENGNIYEGNWKDDEDGQGIMTYVNGDVYKGNWKQGGHHGQGIMTYANGDVYEGAWIWGEKHGYGIMLYANGDGFEGVWIYNTPTDGIIRIPLRLPNGELSGLSIRAYNVKGKDKVKTEYVAKPTGRSISVGRKRGSPSITKTRKSQGYAEPATDLLTGFPGDEPETVRDLLKDKNNLIVTNTGIQNPSSNKLVFSVDAIEYFLNEETEGNQAENWFYECLPRDPKTGIDINTEKPYIGFYVSPNGNKGLVAYNEVKSMLNGGREFELTKTGHFSKTRSWGASYLAEDEIDYVSATHCQDGSEYDVYSLKPVMLSTIRGSPTLQQSISPGRSRPIRQEGKLEKLPPLPSRFMIPTPLSRDA